MMDETQDIIAEDTPDTSEMQDATGGNQNTENEEQNTANEQDTPLTNTEGGEHQSTDTNGGDTQDIPADGGNEQNAAPETSAGNSEEQGSTAEDNSNSNSGGSKEETPSDVNTGGNEEPGTVTDDSNDSGNESSAGEDGSDIGNNEDPPPTSDDESHAGDDVPNGETQDNTNTDDTGEHNTTESNGENNGEGNEGQEADPENNGDSEQNETNTGGDGESGTTTDDNGSSSNGSNDGETSGGGDEEHEPTSSDNEEPTGDDVTSGETQDNTGTDDNGEHGATEDDGGNSDGGNEEQGGANDNDNIGDDSENSGETQGDTENIDDSEPQKPEPLYQSFQYVGEDELKHFLRFSNELYDKKYLPIDGTAKTAENAESADKLSYSVLINGQPFDGTQDITFEEYAKKEDVLFKTDCADAGEIYNGGKIVMLNDESEIDSKFLNANSVVEMATDPIMHLGNDLISRVANISKDFDQTIDEEAGISITSDSICMKQIEVNVPENKSPLIVSLEKNNFKDYCMPPMEILKDESRVKACTLNYLKLDYDFGGAEMELSENNISFAVKDFPLAVNKDFQSDVVITKENYMEHKDSWTHLTPTEVNGEVFYKFYASPLTPEALANKTFTLNLYYPSSEFCYGVLIENDLYYNNNGILEKGATLNGENDDLTILLTLRQGVNNVPITREMIMNENVPKDKDLTIVLIAEEDEVLAPFDMSYSIISGINKCIATPGKYFDELNVDSVKGFSAQYNCDKNSYVTFGVLLSTDDNQQSYVIWDSENQSWKESSIEEATAVTEVTATEESPATEESEVEEPKNEESVIDKPITELVPVWPVVEKLENVPSEAWNFEGKHFSLVYVLMPDNANSECSIYETEMTYKNKPVYKKAIHGIDYDYAYDGDDVVIAFNTSGRFLVNYPTKTA